MPALRQTQSPPAGKHHRPSRHPRPPQAFELTLLLDNITTNDYIQWIRDPDPPSRGDLKLTAVSAPPLGSHIRLEVLAAGEPPPPAIAAPAVGFPITADVIGIQSRPIHPCRLPRCTVE